jgi:hypothetical protein
MRRSRGLLTLIILHIHQISVEAKHGIPGGLAPSGPEDETSWERFAGLSTQRDHGLSVQGLPEAGGGDSVGAEEWGGELFHVGAAGGGGRG